MARASKKIRLIEFKGTTLPVVSVTLRSLQPERLAVAATELFGDDAFFEGDAAILDLDSVDETAVTSPPEPDDWIAIGHLFDKHGLRVVGVSGGQESWRETAAAVGLPSLSAFKRPQKPAPEESLPVLEVIEITPAPDLFQTPAEAPVASPPAPPEPPAIVATPTLIIDRPLRSGQQAYARGGDLVVLAAVNAGAEVIADGSIHVYAPLRGRALAGAAGDTGARIFTTRFEAELVSIAGIYRTFDSGISKDLAGRPVQIGLHRETSDAGDQLEIRALKVD